MVIWKYTLAFTDEQQVRMPEDSKVLAVQMQNNLLTVWATVNPNSKLTDKTFWVVGTGNPNNVPHDARYIGTVQIVTLVFHIFTE